MERTSLQEFTDLATSCGLPAEVTLHLITEGITSPQIFASRFTQDTLEEKLEEWIPGVFDFPVHDQLRNLWSQCQPHHGRRPRDSTPSGRPKGHPKGHPKAKARAAGPDSTAGVATLSKSMWRLMAVVKVMVETLLRLGVIGVVVLGFIMVVSNPVHLPVICAGFVPLVCLIVIGYIVLGVIKVTCPVLAEFVKEFGVVAKLVISVDLCCIAYLLYYELPFWLMTQDLVETIIVVGLRILKSNMNNPLEQIFLMMDLKKPEPTQYPFAMDTFLKWLVFICLGLGGLLLKKLTGGQAWIRRRKAMLAVVVAFQLFLGYAILEENAKLAAWEWRTFGKAYYEGDVSAARWFYRRGAKNIDVVCGLTKSEYGHLDFHPDLCEGIYNFAALKGRMDMVRMLMKEGEDVNQVSWRGRTGLMFAARGGHVEVARLLLDGKADVNYHKINSKRDHTALHEAALGGHMELARFLLQNGAELDPGARFQPLHAAAEGGHVEMVKFLLEQGAHVDEADRGSTQEPGTGETALHQATYEGHKEVVRELVKAKANIYATTTYHSYTTRWGARTALDIARKTHPSLLRILEESE